MNNDFRLNTQNNYNMINLKGKLCNDFIFDHEIYGEKFYATSININRLSGTCDTLPLIISERLIQISKNYLNSFVSISGQIRTRNITDGDKTHLQIYIFVKEIYTSDDEQNLNIVKLHGFICKDSSYRTTPNGREISDVLLAVNRTCKRSDYIPCICWNRNAKFANSLPVGSEITITGRMQSRKYTKQMDDGLVDKVAYEISVNTIECI